MDSDKGRVTEDLIQETENFWENPRCVMNLIDLLFLWEDPDKKQICS